MKIIHNVILCYLIIKLLFSKSIFLMGFPGGSDGKESSCNAGGSRDRGLIRAMAAHSSILAWRIPMDRGSWQAAAHGVAESWT